MPLPNPFRPKSNFLPISAYFDNLYSEFKAIEQTILDEDAKKSLEEIHTRRQSLNKLSGGKFTWADVLEFELILLKFLPTGDLRNKTNDLREQYRVIFGDEAYQAYLKTNPPDVQNATDDELRAGISYLLNKLLKAFAALSARNGLRKWVTKWAAFLIALGVVIGAVLLFTSYKNVPIVQQKPPGSPILIVLFAGAMGGLVSIIQRLESATFDGDPVFSLAKFWHGAYSFFVSPVTGAIFGALLYLLFTGNVLEGRFFPKIASPQGQCVCSDCGPVAPLTSTTSQSSSTSTTTTPSPTPTPSPSPSPAVRISFQSFLECTGPATGGDFALLIIWCFIAGFAERFVPDTLSRLISESDKTEQTKEDEAGKNNG